MDPVLGILLLLGLGAACKSAWDHVWREYRRSRDEHMAKAAKHAGPAGMSSLHRKRVASRHALGWWAREVGQGFPFTRTGLHAGWLAHRTATDHLRGRREEERTTHLDTRAALLKAIREHRQRQAEAQAQIDAALTASPEPVKGRHAVDELATRRASKDGETPAPPLPADSVTSPAPRVEGNADVTRTNGSGPPAPPPGTTVPVMEGNPMANATDTNYTESIELARRVEAEAEAAAQDIRWQQMGNTVDQLGAMLSADPDSLSEAAEVADALRAQKEAAEHAAEAATLFRAGLQKRHGGIKQAADDSPAAQPAQPEFYVD